MSITQALIERYDTAFLRQVVRHPALSPRCRALIVDELAWRNALCEAA